MISTVPCATKLSEPNLHLSINVIYNVRPNLEELLLIIKLKDWANIGFLPPLMITLDCCYWLDSLRIT